MAEAPPPDSPPGPSPGSDAGDEPPPGTGPLRRPGRSLVIGGAVAVVVVAVGAVAIRAVAGGEAVGDCLPSLGVPEQVDSLLRGADLERARALVDEPPGPELEDAQDFERETGFMIDPLSDRVRYDFHEDPPGDLFYGWTDVECWVGEFSHFVARGSFDEARLAESPALAEEVALDGDVMTYTEPPRDGPTPDRPEVPPVDELLEVLYRNDVVGFGAWADAREKGRDAVWFASGTAQGEGPEMLLVWAFPSEDGAVAGEPEARRVLGGESAVGDFIEGDPAELLQRDGSTLMLRAPLRADGPAAPRPTDGPDPIVELFRD